MDMKHHLIAGLREVYERWEQLLAGLSETQATSPLGPSSLSIKDELAHLRAWQERSIARAEAAAAGHEPAMPAWPPELDPEADDADSINAWIHETTRDELWASVHKSWRAGFERFLVAARQVSERDMLDGDRYPWLKPYSLANVLLGTYDHHQEHLEKILVWLGEGRAGSLSGFPHSP